ncbi:MAG: hypothetical protein M1829_001529 [Trizodia sp. TS-e1964]|nr:MAG: hypothetical protein M1829_001529 [Trizodia sp. TS-e1964]
MNDQAPRLSQGTRPTVKRYYRIPNRRVCGFIGSEVILEEIVNQLSPSSTSRIVVLRGMGGQGKTQIALEYCHQAIDRQFLTIFWIDATSESSLKKSFEVISEDIRPAAMTLSSTDSSVDFAIASLSAWPSPWLMVFDNYDDPTAFENLPHFLPNNKNGSILIKTRHADVDALAKGGKAIELHGLKENFALKLFFRQSGTVEVDRDIEQGRNIVERLGYHPLAITQAGAYITKRKIALKDFMDHYNRRRKIILDQTPQMSQYRRRLTDAQNETSLSVFTIWELSFQQLETMQADGKTKADLLTFFAFFHCKDITERLFKEFHDSRNSNDQVSCCIGSLGKIFRGAWDSDQFLDTLGELKDLSILQTFSEGADGFATSRSIH